MKIAIIGSGIAGLAAAYRLSMEPSNRVTLIERESDLGLSAQTIAWQPREVEAFDGKSLAGDVPSRMFNEAQWPQLAKLYQQAGVQSVQVDAGQSFSHCDPNANDESVALQPATYLQLNDALRPSIGSQLLRSESREILRDAVRFRQQGQQDLECGIDAKETLLEYLQRRGFSDSFRLRFLYPTLSSTVCTCSFESLDRYPATVVLAALDRLTGSDSLRRLKHSACDVADRLTDAVDDVRLDCQVQQVTENGRGVEIRFAESAAETFDRVIVATQANTASRLWEKIPDGVAECLSVIQYEDVRVVVHQDSRLMPHRAKQWATFNMVSSTDWQQAMCTVWMNRFHDDWPPAEPLFQTINPFVCPDKLISEIVLQRPVVTSASQQAIQRIQEIQASSNARVLLAGSWADCGVPLLESGVTSAWAACEAVEASKLLRVSDE